MSPLERAMGVHDHALQARESAAWLVAADAWEDAGLMPMAVQARFAATLDARTIGAIAPVSSGDLLSALHSSFPAPSAPPVSMAPAGVVQPYVVTGAAYPARATPWVMGLKMETIRAGKMIRMIEQPMIPFRIHRLALEGRPSLEDVFILDLQIGRNSQLVNASPVPATLFGPRAFPLQLHFNTCDISQLVTVHVLNRSPHDVEVSGAFAGLAVE